MTTETAAEHWDSSALTTSSSLHAEGATRPADGASSEDVARMVIALGALLGWQGAFLLDHDEVDSRRALTRTWAPADHHDSAADPGWLWQVHGETWDRRRVLWRTVTRRDGGQCAFVAVPVRCRGEVRGALCFYGVALRHPDDAAIGLLEAIAGMLAHDLDRSRPDAGPMASNGAAEGAIAMVDVFAYTVRVGRDGSLQWRYFGPNSEAIFGQGVFPDEPVTALVRRYAHIDDGELVAEFAQALLEGTPLDVDFRINGLDGVTRWTSWRTVPRYSDGAVHVDGVVTDVSARHSLDATASNVSQDDLDTLLRTQARNVRDANDNVLQRIFAAGLRLQMLKRKLSDVEAHAITAIAFQLDQAATDLREVIIDLSAVADGDAA